MKKRWLCCLALLLALACMVQAVPAGALAALFLSEKELTLSSGERESLSANQRVSWTSEDARIASVTPDGEVTAHKNGSVMIVAKTPHGQRKAVRVEVKGTVKPRRIEIGEAGPKLALGETLGLSASIWPTEASQKILWSSSNKKIASVSAAGVVTPRKEGKVRIIARAKAKTSVRATLTLAIYDPFKPTSLTLDPKTSFLEVGERQALSVEILPQTADRALTWASSRADVAAVDENGHVVALSPGRAVITATSARGKLRAEAQISVLNDERVTEIPARTTAQVTSAVKANIAKIDAVYESALDEMDRLVAKGEMGESDYAKRKKILINGFSMYRFPWYTQTRVDYWNSSYNGAKDYLKGRVYYGLPYIQTGKDNKYTNRRYNVAKAVSSGYYARGSGGIYRMTAKRMGARYVGNDCSSFLAMATFLGNGYTLNSSICYMVTSELAKTASFNTIGYDGLRPGDMLVKSGVHTVMFLYYTNQEKTRMMILEQGGGDSSDMHNTVTVSLVNRSSYSGSYIARRASFLKKT